MEWAQNAILRYLLRGEFVYPSDRGTKAPDVLSGTNWFGRRMLQITPDFQSPLGVWSSQVIPKGTYIKMGLVGPQEGVGFGTWFQFYAPQGVKFIKP